jgi:hypothetical protein
MLIKNKVNPSYKSGGQLESTGFKVVNAGRFIMNQLRNLYDNPVGAVVRELSTNAREASLLAGKDGDFYIHLPTVLEPWFSVKDQGIGMSEEDLREHTSGLGSTTKCHTNEIDGNQIIGGFGMGMKSPLAYTEQFNVTSIKDGYKTTAIVSITEDGPTYSKVYHGPTDEGNGTEIKLSVSERDHGKFISEVKKQLRFFDPQPCMNYDVEFPNFDDKILYQNDKCTIYKMTTQHISYVVTDVVAYPLEVYSLIPEYSKRLPFDIRVPVGSVKVPMARESIIIDDDTTEYLRGIYDQAYDEMVDQMQDDINSQPNYVKKYRRAQDYLNSVSDVELPDEPEMDAVFRLFEKRQLEMKTNPSMFTTGSKFLIIISKYYPISNIIIGKDTDKNIPSTVNYNFDGTSGAVYYVEGLTEDFIRGLGYEGDIYYFDDLPKPSKVKPKPKNTMPRLFLLDISFSYYGTEYKTEYRIDNLDKDTGIWVSMQKGIISSDDRHMLKLLINYNIIPKDTKIFGVPKNVKNKLMGHPNYMSVEEVHKMTMDSISQDMKNRKEIYDKFIVTNELLKGDFLPKNYLDKYVRPIYTNVSGKINIKEVTYYNSYEPVFNTKDEVVDRYKTMVFNKYPLLKYITDNTPVELIDQYMKGMQ